MIRSKPCFRGRNQCRFMTVLILCALFLLSIPFYPAALAEGRPDAEFHVFLNGVSLSFDTQPLFPEEGPMLPLRAMGEQAGFTVDWENEHKRATLHGVGTAITLYPGNPLYAVNGILKRTGQPPQLQHGRLLVSLDFLEEGAGLVLQDGAPQKGYLYFESRKPDFADDLGEQPVYFVELLLPPEDRVAVDERFEMRLATPFVPGIFAYEISFFYNPDIFQVKDVHNPGYQPSHEFQIKQINNNEGIMRYTLTTLGAQDDLPPRDILAVIEAVVSREGAVPLIEGTLKVTLLDNRVRSMPVGLEERVLYVGPAAE